VKHLVFKVPESRTSARAGKRGRSVEHNRRLFLDPSTGEPQP